MREDSCVYGELWQVTIVNLNFYKLSELLFKYGS